MDKFMQINKARGNYTPGEQTESLCHQCYAQFERPLLHLVSIQFRLVYDGKWRNLDGQRHKVFPVQLLHSNYWKVINLVEILRVLIVYGRFHGRLLSLGRNYKAKTLQNRWRSKKNFGRVKLPILIWWVSSDPKNKVIDTKVFFFFVL